jgi:lauroyl/myristoyl acyltransferase
VEISGQNVKELSVSLFAAYVLEKLEVLASWLGRYRPSNLRLEGVSRLQEALKQGHGAVLWCESCNSSSLLLKATLESAGFQVHQLSRPGHNLSNTRFGMRFLNPIVRKAEDRYLAERILVDETNTLAVSRRIMDLLKDNGVVSVTVNSQGSQVIESPVLDGVLRVATGAPHFALRSGAPLLPLFSYRDGDEYVVEIGEPIPLAGMGRERAYEFAVGELARRLSDYVEEHPLDWCGWLRGGYSGPVP